MTKAKPIIEICANSVESAVIAQQSGADRVELCAGMSEGGTTPSFGEISQARKLLSTTKLNVIIRPRGGDFLYSTLEQEIMLRDIELCCQSGVDGVVIGCLTPEGDVDIPLRRKLLDAAGGMSVTFHRAFDVCRDPFKALEDIIGLGIDRILTSGQEPTAERGIPLLKELVERSGGRVVIMPGSGVNASNIRRIAEETKAHEFHFSGRAHVESGMVYRSEKVSMGGTTTIADYRREVTDIKIVQSAIYALTAKE